MKKGYKGFNKDLQCRGFQYELGKTYECETAEVCSKGFHYCKKIKDVLDYYPITSRFCEIEDLGKTVTEQNKSATTKIKIVKELTRDELVELFKYKNDNLGKNNLGDKNTGDWNTGYRNTGNSNTGDKNTGNSNTGDWNTGDWNKCNNETGFFNSKDNKYCNVFNKNCLRSKFIEAKKPDFIYNVNPNIWVDWDNMNDDEKKTHPNSYTQGGYLKSISKEEAWKIAFEKATDEDIELLKKLPNYDYDVFSEITGLIDERLK